jgi:hypothetical protein
VGELMGLAHLQLAGVGKARSVEAYGLLISRRVRHTIPPGSCPEIGDYKHWPKVLEHPGGRRGDGADQEQGHLG